MSRNYYIHDNGGRPFKVSITQNKFYIYKILEIKQIKINNKVKWKDIYEENPILTSKYNKVFIGKDKNIKNSIGNSILFEIKKNTYIQVGRSVQLIETPEPIIKYVSNIGNSDVVYPYAYTNNYVYLFLDSYATYKNNIVGTDPYMHYYQYLKNNKEYPLLNKVKGFKSKIIIKRLIKYY